jgi:hypothetical protein
MSGTVARSLGNLADALGTTATANVNIDGGVLFVDSVNNRVGVGTNVPQSPLHVAGAGRFGATSTESTGACAIYNDGNNVTIEAFAGNNAATKRNISLATYGGYVLRPSQPMFMGSPTNDYSGGSMPTGVIPFTVLYNNGSHYNAGTSRFTAPVAGWYRITWGGLQLPLTVTSLQVNGTRTYNGNHLSSTTAGAPQYVSMTQTVLRTLNANDYLTIEGWNGGGYYNAWYLWSVELVA